MLTVRLTQSATLADIARRHGFSDWHPVWNYNSKVKKNHLPADPQALLPVGSTLMIPNTPQEYNHIISSLRHTRRDLQEDTALTLQQLQQAKKTADAWGTGVDLAADIAEIFVASGVKAIRYTGIVRRQMIEKTAIHTLQKATAFAGRYDAEDVEDGEKLKRTAAKSASEALADQALKRKFSSAGRGFAKGFAAGMVSEGVGHKFGELARVIAVAALQGVEAAVESIQPSKLAQYYVKITTGQSPEKTYEQAVELARKTAADSAHLLDASIHRLSTEKNAVYGHPAASAPLAKSASGLP